MSELLTNIAPASWAALCVVVPIVGALASFLAGRAGAIVGLLFAPVVTLVASALVWQTYLDGAHHHSMGGWGAPVGIDLYVDGLSASLVAVTSLVGLFVSVYAWGFFASHPRAHFWPLWLTMWGGLHAMFLSADVFNLYVGLEIVGLSSVALIALGGPDAIVAAMRYLFVTLLGSMLYLMGVALLYSGFGTLDIALLGARVSDGPVAIAALSFISAGLLLKTALFPLHFWLPPAHASAPAPVSAVLSALVLKGSFYLLLRLWLNVFPAILDFNVARAAAVLGFGAIVWGSLQALLQTKLKLLVAYSTVAQIGYLFVFLPPALLGAPDALRGGLLYLMSHALAKAAMFMAAGNFAHATGSGEINALHGTGRRLLLVFSAFSMSSITLMGLPPSGAFIGKWLIATAAIETGQWLIVGVLFLGGLLTAAYVFKVLQTAFTPPHDGVRRELEPIPVTMLVAPLVLAFIAFSLGLYAFQPLAFLDIGSPFEAPAQLTVAP